MIEIRKFTEKESGYFSIEIFLNWGDLRIKIFSLRRKPRFLLKIEKI